MSDALWLNDPVPVPNLLGEDRDALFDFFSVYEPHYAAIRDEMAVRLGGAEASAGGRSEAVLALERHSLELQQQAVHAGDWRPFLAYLWEQGVQAAKAGLSFSSFYQGVAAFG